MAEASLRILFATPAYWPAIAFGGPIWMARELNEGMVQRGHSVDVVTTGLVDLDRQPAARTRTRTVGGVRVHYLGTPLRYRWMGITPALPLWLRRQPRPDVVHIFGYRDVVSTIVAAWCGVTGVPYVFEPLGMYLAKLRKVRLKRVLDATVARHVARRAAVVVATSDFERRELVAAGLAHGRVHVRPNGFPPPLVRPRRGDGRLRRELGLAASDRVVLYVGRIAEGKGIELLLDAARALPGFQLVLAGPAGRDSTIGAVRAAALEPALAGRVHHLPPRGSERPLELYGEADLFVLPSQGESFGMVAAEAAAAGTASVVTDRCGVAELLRDRAALVVPYDREAIRAGIERVLSDDALRLRLGAGGAEVAAELSWATIVARQEALYRRVLAERA